ncbi:serine--tRNA ligase, partial [bacterium]|nr:serine--tRNA ligase [bacterium]
MLDIKLIRENPEGINELLKRRNPDLSVDEVIKIDEQRRKVQFELDNLRAKRKTESNKIGLLKKEGKDTTQIQAEIRAMGDEVKKLEEALSDLDLKQKTALLYIPNTPDPEIPIGADESANVEIKRWGEPAKFDFEYKAHWDLCPELGMLDFERGVKL